MNIIGNSKISDFLRNGVFQLDQDFFPRPWKEDDWRGLNPLHHKLYLLQDGSKTIGFALFSHLPDDETAHLLKICLHPSFRGLGKAKTFWPEMMKDLLSLRVKNVFLEVEEPNLRAITFYQKMGFEKIRTVKSYYSDGTNGVMMNLTL